MRRSTATTLQDVAREVGVATITASVVLNGSRSATRVSEATRARIVEVATRLNYRPNGVARGLTRRRMDAVGVVSRFVGKEANMYFTEVLTGILEAAARFSQNTTIISVSDWAAEEDKILQFCDGRIDGLILVGPDAVTEGFAKRLLNYAPCVVMHNNDPFEGADSMDVDSEEGFYSVVKHLISLGHRKIAHFSGPLRSTGSRQRIDGYRRALSEEGLPVDPELLFVGDFDARSGIENTEALLARYRGSDRPTAVSCVNDTVAAACVETLAAHNISVPGQISVVGFDDTVISRMSAPPLTTVRQPLRQMGTYAVDRLLMRIQESIDRPKSTPAQSTANVHVDGAKSVSALDDLAAPHREIFPVTLVVRGSSGPPPQNEA
jgi:LacI family transcriptional regulator